MQRTLASEQLKEFDTDSATADQVRAFITLRPMMDLGAAPIVVDIGGGHGYFALALQGTLHRGVVRVLDSDPASVQGALTNGVPARLGDALSPIPEGDEDVVTLNLLLHHLVGATEEQTRSMQMQALKAWKGRARLLFVSEYCYSSGGAFMYQVTSSKRLSRWAARVARFIPTLRANTFGVGVRFRSHEEWLELFRVAGFTSVAAIHGRQERIRLARLLFGISAARQDFFLLQAK